MTGDDPYQAPTVVAEASLAEESMTLDALARRTFLAWEKLRVLYVAILVAITLATAALHGLGMLATVKFWITTGVGAVFANIAFLAGPVVETYVRWLGYRGEVLRPILFCVGSVFACVLAAFTIGLLNSQTLM